MRLIKRVFCFLVCVGLLATAANAGSVILYNNLSASTEDYDEISDSIFGPLSDSFSTGASSVRLTDVKVLLELFGSPTGSVTVSLLSSNETTMPYPSPGSTLLSIGTVSDTSIPPVPLHTPTVVDVPVPSYSLAANTRYWIQLGSTNGSTAGWDFSLDTSGTGVASEYFANPKFGVTPNLGNDPYQMQVSGFTGTIPEPTSVVLLGVGIGGIIVVSRFRKRRAA